MTMAESSKQKDHPFTILDNDCTCSSSMFSTVGWAIAKAQICRKVYHISLSFFSRTTWMQNIDTHTTILLLVCNMSGSTRVSRYQKDKTKKVKTNLDLLEQEIVSGSGICWAICKSAPHPRQPRQHPTTQFFYRPDALPDTQPTASKHWRQKYCQGTFKNEKL